MVRVVVARMTPEPTSWISTVMFAELSALVPVQVQVRVEDSARKLPVALPVIVPEFTVHLAS